MFMQSPANQVAGNRLFDCILIALAAPDLIILQSDYPASRAAPLRSAASSPGRGLHFLFWSPVFCFKSWGHPFFPVCSFQPSQFRYLSRDQRRYFINSQFTTSASKFLLSKFPPYHSIRLSCSSCRGSPNALQNS